MHSALELALWLILAATLAQNSFALVRSARQQRQLGALLGVLVLAGVLRLLVPFGPANWYLSVGSGESPLAFARPTALAPLPLRALARDWLPGARVFNGLASLAGIALFWYVATLAGNPRRAALVFAGLFATVPLYVRYAATDTGHTTQLLLFALAAVTFLRIWRRAATPLDFAGLSAALALGMPIRLESGVLFFAVPLFAWRGGWQPRALRNHAPLAVALLLGWAVGGMSLWQFHGPSLRLRVAAHLLSAAFVVLSQATLLVNPVGVFFFPPLLAVPVWLHVAALARIRAWTALAVLYAPIFACALPLLFVDGAFVSLPIGGYYLVGLVFSVLAIALAIDGLWVRVHAALATRRRWQIAAALALVPCAWLFALKPYTYTYAWQEEYHFLLETLPRKPATILVLWDPSTHGGDLDCCLALPYPSLMAARPDLHWVVLTLADANRESLRDRHFDYYYPGAMLQLDPTSLEGRYAKVVAPDPTRRERQRAHVAALRALDNRVHAQLALQPVASAVVPAHTFSAMSFKDDAVTLQLFGVTGAPR